MSRVPWPGLGSCRPSGLGWLHLDPSWGEGVGAPGTQHTSCGERRCLHRCPGRTRGPRHCVTGGALCSWALTPPCCPGPHPHPQQLLACHLDVPLCLSWVCSVGGPAWGTGGHVASEVPLSSRHGPWAAVCPPWGCRAAHRPPWALGEKPCGGQLADGPGQSAVHTRDLPRHRGAHVCDSGPCRRHCRLSFEARLGLPCALIWCTDWLVFSSFLLYIYSNKIMQQ